MKLFEVNLYHFYYILIVLIKVSRHILLTEFNYHIFPSTTDNVINNVNLRYRLQAVYRNTIANESVWKTLYHRQQNK